MKNKKKGSSKTEVLKFCGDLTIENAQELHKILLTALDKAEQLLLTFENVTATDLSFVQLLCSAHRTAVRSDKNMKLDSQRPEVLKAAVREMGLIREKGCVLDTQESCIWKEGWE
ncbi:MAG: STAS domain-containing protein [Deltaproteobacteria bacterium]|nr:STAS domain-containing protein [Deltaproteobacteria bacterium]